MIHPALTHLLRLQFRARFRWMFGGSNTRKVRGKLFMAIGVGVLLLSLAPSVVYRVMHDRKDPQSMRVILPIGMLAFVIASLISAAGERAIAFTPAETDFLFPGPFTRRELLGYKILKGAGTSLISSAIFATLLWQYAPSWIIAYLAAFLGLMFLQLLGIAIMLGAMSISEHAHTRMRRFVLIAALVIGAAALAPVIAAARGGGSIDLAAQLQQSPAMRIVLAPFSVFGNILAAPNSGLSALKWIGAAGAMVLGLLAIVMRLDVFYLDVSANAGRRRYERFQRARTRGIGVQATNTHFRPPMLPCLGGIGPIAWRQLTTAVRQSRGLLTLLVIIGIGAGIFAYTQRDKDGTALHSIGGVLLWASVMLSNTLRLDFRGDVDLIDSLKALPIAPIAVCAAEIVAPALLMTTFHLSVIAMAAFAAAGKMDLLVLAAVLALPVNLLLFAIENLMFLLHPTRFVSSGPGDLQGSGRTMMLMFVKLLILSLALGLAGGFGALTHVFTNSLAAAGAAALVVMIIEIAAMLALMAAAFKRYDPSIHTPT